MRRTVAVSSALFFLVAVASAQSPRPRVFISDSDSWEVSGGLGGIEEGPGGVSGGARPQTVEIMKTFRERCPQAVVNRDESRADFVVLLDHEGGKVLRRDNKVAVFAANGDLIYSGSTRSLGNAVKNACQAITTEWIGGTR